MKYIVNLKAAQLFTVKMMNDGEVDVSEMGDAI